MWVPRADAARIHAALSIQALQAGAHVLVEKTDGRNAGAMQADDGGCPCQRTHSGRGALPPGWNPIVLRGVEIVLRGASERVISIDFIAAQIIPAWPGGGKLPPQYRKGSYPFQDLGVHGLAIAEAFFRPGQIGGDRFQLYRARLQSLFDEWTAKVKCERGRRACIFRGTCARSGAGLRGMAHAA